MSRVWSLVSACTTVMVARSDGFFLNLVSEMYTHSGQKQSVLCVSASFVYSIGHYALPPLDQMMRGILFLVCLSTYLTLSASFDLYKLQCSNLVCIFLGVMTFQMTSLLTAFWPWPLTLPGNMILHKNTSVIADAGTAATTTTISVFDFWMPWFQHDLSSRGNGEKCVKPPLCVHTVLFFEEYPFCM